MGKDTSIQWADDSLNLQMGCDGCELWNKLKRICYAGKQIDGDGVRPGFRGQKGWPASFAQPKLFLERLDPALKWKDLTGKEREDKPWLNGYPRLIFLNDMGDTFTKGLPLNWLAPLLGLMGSSPHQFLLLTKRPSRMAEFSESHPFPNNFWLGTSITTNQTIPRIEQLMKCKGGSVRFASVEPIWEDISEDCYDGLDWAIFGGQSGSDDDCTPTALETLWNGVERARKGGARPFVKQVGSRPYFMADVQGRGTCEVPFKTKDFHGGDWSEWPMNLRIREMPELRAQTLL